MLSYFLLIFFFVIVVPTNVILPRGCEKWFLFHPSRCQHDSMYLQWCPVGGRRICRVINPDAMTRRCPHPGCSDETSSDSSEARTKKPKHVKPPTMGPRRTLVTRAPRPRPKPVTKCTNCETKSNSVTEDRQSKTKETESTMLSGNLLELMMGAVKPLTRTSTTTPEPNRRSFKPVTDKNVEKVFKSCARENGVARECLIFASFNFTVESKAAEVCERTECLDYLPQVMYCGSNGLDHYDRCCKKKDIPPLCEPFCNGEKTIRIATMFPDLISAIDFFPCFEHRFEILTCIGHNHDGTKRTKRRKWPDDKVDPEIVDFVKQLSCEYAN